MTQRVSNDGRRQSDINRGASRCPVQEDVQTSGRAGEGEGERIATTPSRALDAVSQKSTGIASAQPHHSPTTPSAATALIPVALAQLRSHGSSLSLALPRSPSLSLPLSASLSLSLGLLACTYIHLSPLSIRSLVPPRATPSPEGKARRRLLNHPRFVAVPGNVRMRLARARQICLPQHRALPAAPVHSHSSSFILFLALSLPLTGLDALGLNVLTPSHQSIAARHLHQSS